MWLRSTTTLTSSQSERSEAVMCKRSRGLFFKFPFSHQVFFRKRLKKVHCDQLLPLFSSLREICLRSAFPCLLSQSSFSVFPITGYCWHRKDNEDSTEACRSLRAQNDQSSRVSYGCEDLKNKTGPVALLCESLNFRLLV